MSQNHSYTVQIPLEDAGHRLDQVCAQMFPDFSRGRIQTWIKEGDLLVNKSRAKAKQKVIGGEWVDLNVTVKDEGDWLPEPMDLEIVHEDDAIIVLNKPAGLVVHPAAGNWDGTLLNGLLHHAPELKTIPRAGIVHRLDKDTSGLMVVAKTLQAQTHLVNQLQARTVSRHYQAVTINELAQSEGTIDTPIGRNTSQRTKMSVVNVGGKPAITHFWALKYLRGFTHIHVQLETGRTHQIRVHMAYLGYPLVGDEVYGVKKLPLAIKNANENYLAAQNFGRQALHAWKLSLMHPETEQPLSWEADLPEDMVALICQLDAE